MRGIWPDNICVRTIMQGPLFEVLCGIWRAVEKQTCSRPSDHPAKHAQLEHYRTKSSQIRKQTNKHTKQNKKPKKHFSPLLAFLPNRKKHSRQSLTFFLKKKKNSTSTIFNYKTGSWTQKFIILFFLPLNLGCELRNAEVMTSNLPLSCNGSGIANNFQIRRDLSLVFKGRQEVIQAPVEPTDQSALIHCFPDTQHASFHTLNPLLLLPTLSTMYDFSFLFPTRTQPTTYFFFLLLHTNIVI